MIDNLLNMVALLGYAPLRTGISFGTAPQSMGLWRGGFCALAAAYAFVVARNHPFTDGNKRTAWVLARLFLGLNDIRITFTPEDAAHMVLALAEGTLTEEDVAEWFKRKLA
jgi:fido (protein-threonine AMPylation protein)